MNKAKLIEKIHAEVGVSKKDAEKMIDTLVDTIIEELKNDREVTITGFGTFLARTRHARGGVNPQKPSERIRIPAVKVAKFKTGKTLKDALKMIGSDSNGNTDTDESVDEEDEDIE